MKILPFVRRKTHRLLPRCECLTALLIPKILLQQTVSPSTINQFFDPFIPSFRDAVQSVYGSHPYHRYGPDDHGILGGVVALEETIITYYLTPYKENFRLQDTNSTLYLGTLDLRQECLDLAQAGTFLTQLLSHAVIAYNTEDPFQPRFMIFHDHIYDDSAHLTVSKGTVLLQQLEVSPQEGCAYHTSTTGLAWELVRPCQLVRPCPDKPGA